ncbi:MAG: MBL fold metallo-hydrolase [Acidobacteria bacterium]|nr:MAG: MBL fold metallo-hydrolase [Acidobacteriota bacterium]
MYFKQFYLGCLAHASYLIGSEGEAAVVDPQRDVDLYIMEASAEGLAIKYVIETHLHADFVSGHSELAARTGALIIFGEKACATFPHRAVHDGDEIRLGKVVLRFLETPGHTPESISVLVISTEVSNEARKVLTGDTLFIGDVGRPDLADARGYTSEQMAAMLYNSLHEKLLKLDDDVEVYPAHGAGSMCGRNISKETSSTIGQQRAFNYALKPMSKDEFVRMMTKDLPPAPPYFSHDAEQNREGALAIKEIARPAALAPEDAAERIRQGFMILDVRPASEFGAGHAPTALNIGLGGQFASWAGTLIPMNTSLIIMADDAVQVDEAIVRLARVGHESVKGFLKGGMDGWKRAGLPVATVEQISVERLRELLDKENDLQLLDVRRPAEYADGHAPGALNLPLNSQLGEQAARFDANSRTAVICAGGYRSSAATSILSRSGFNHVLNVEGGTTAWINAGYPVEKA